MRHASIGDFLTDDQMQKCINLYYECKRNNALHSYAKRAAKEIIEPIIDIINEKLGQENDPLYLAYMTYYAISTAE